MKKYAVLSLLIALSLQTSFCQVKIDSSEITSTVPELSAFHEIIFPMWHQAYPDKDIQALKGFVPEIRKSMDAINKAVLPGILHDKKTDWENQLKQLNGASDKYYQAAEKQDDKALLDAAEDLHRNYEMMVRVIRPALKEIDAYHQTLYIIFHKLYPEKKYSEITQLMDGLVQKADAIVNCQKDERLKRRLNNDFSGFDSAAKNLYDATLVLRDSLKGNDNAEKDQAVTDVHSAYVKLDSLF
jgi:hypothetical protein